MKILLQLVYITNPELTGSLGVSGACGFAAGPEAAPGSLAGGFRDSPSFFLARWLPSRPELKANNSSSLIGQKAASVVVGPRSRSYGSLGHTGGAGVGVSFWPLLSIPGSQASFTTCEGRRAPLESNHPVMFNTSNDDSCSAAQNSSKERVRHDVVFRLVKAARWSGDAVFPHAYPQMSPAPCGRPAISGQGHTAELDGVPEVMQPPATPHVTDGEAEPGRWADLPQGHRSVARWDLSPVSLLPVWTLTTMSGCVPFKVKRKEGTLHCFDLFHCSFMLPRPRTLLR